MVLNNIHIATYILLERYPQLVLTGLASVYLKKLIYSDCLALIRCIQALSSILVWCVRVVT